MLTDRRVNPVEAYLNQPPLPLNPKAPRRDADLPPGSRLPLALALPYTLYGVWYRRTPYLERARARYGTPFTTWIRLPAVPFVWFDDPAEVKAIFQAPADVLYAGNGSYELEHFFGRTGLAYLEEDEHLTRRKVVNRCAHGDALSRVNDATREIAAREIASWPRDELFEIWDYADRLAVSVVFQVCFGSDPDERISELRYVVEEMLPYNELRQIGVFPIQEVPPTILRLLSAIRPLGFNRFFELRARADHLIYSMIADRRRTGAAADGMLGVLLDATGDDGAPVPAVEIRDELMTTFLAGSATTAAGISFGLDHLAREHAVRERLVAEIDAGDDESYLTATVSEVLRRNPPLTGVIPRTVMKPIEINGRWYPVGTRLVPSPYLVHHNPAVYPDPYAFRPERFLDDPPGLFTWIPFGGGRRRCLGKAIAENELKYVLHEVLAHYRLYAEDGNRARTSSYSISTRPAKGTRLALSARS